MKFSFLERQQKIKKLSETEYDIAIIGGGITGAGMARDAASRGMKVALIEASDFASGTSSRSSKLIHGGIRYLENFEFHLVFEALSERKTLFEIAPHMVHPLRFLLPIYKSSRVGMFKMGLGMWLYDALSLFRAPKLHEKLNAKKSVQRISVLQPQDLTGSYVYSDAYMDDDRLVIETLRSANLMGADQVSYVKAISSEMKDNKVVSVGCQDQISQQKFTLKAKHFVSTVGPWTDQLGESLLHQWKKILRPSKGIHITLDRKRLDLPCAVVMATGSDNRIVFGIPRHEMIIIGTTDTDFNGDPASVLSEKSDIDYLLKVVGQYFPGANIKEEDIIASYAGVRPLVNDGSDTESKTSREHVIICDPRNVTFVAGGKYTTYRRMSEQAVEKLLKNYFPKAEQKKFSQNKTKISLNPKITPESFAHAQSRVLELKNKTHFDLKTIQILVDRHGQEAFDLISMYYNPTMKSVWELEAHFAIENSMCGKLKDFYLRRAPLFLAERDHGHSLLESLSHIFKGRLGWTEDERKSNVEDILKHEAFELSWRK
jgi:glycerol-3-phosphate dehydrogenase